MISFFRRIRQILLREKKFSDYLIYAIGEIFLVVIGILIALQVNNWNENRKIREQERQIIYALSTEVSSNLAILSDCDAGLIKQMLFTDSLQSYLGPEYPGLPNEQLFSLMGATGNAGRCNLNTGILDELRSSGNLKIIQNMEIRQALSQWSTAYEQLLSEENEWAEDLSTQYYPYTNKWISWDDIDYYYAQISSDQPDESSEGYDIVDIPSKFDYDPNKMLQQFEYANLLSVQLWRQARVSNFLNVLQKKTKVLDSLLRKEMK